MARDSASGARAGPDRRPSWLNTALGAAFILLGGFVIWQAQAFEDIGRTMPVFVGSGLILLSLVLIGLAWIRPGLIGDLRMPEGSNGNRLVLVVIMAVWVAVMPWFGFLATSAVCFALVTLAVPRARAWSAADLGLHAAGGLVVIFLFWFVLARLLNIPLP